MPSMEQHGPKAPAIGSAPGTTMIASSSRRRAEVCGFDPEKFPPGTSARVERTTAVGGDEKTYLFSKGKVKQGSLHYTPEHCLVNGGFPLFWWKKQHVSNGQNVSFKEPCQKQSCFQKVLLSSLRSASPKTSKGPFLGPLDAVTRASVHAPVLPEAMKWVVTGVLDSNLKSTPKKVS